MIAGWEWALGAAVGITTLVWVISLFARDASLIDLFWGPLFAAQGWVYRWRSDDAGLASLLAVVIVTAWAIRLTVHLARRNLGKGEDPRYAAMRAAGGPSWPMRSLVTVFWLQAGLSWVVALPLAVVAGSPVPAGVVVGLGALVAVVGLLVETVADLQLASFKSDPSRKGQVLDTGLWRYSRHPNYFGDAVFWWGIYLMAVGAGGTWTVVGPILMTLLLMKVSGVPMLESRMEETRPGYREYVRRTPAFFPWIPRSE